MDSDFDEVGSMITERSNSAYCHPDDEDIDTFGFLANEAILQAGTSYSCQATCVRKDTFLTSEPCSAAWLTNTNIRRERPLFKRILQEEIESEYLVGVVLQSWEKKRSTALTRPSVEIALYEKTAKCVQDTPPTLIPHLNKASLDQFNLIAVEGNARRIEKPVQKSLDRQFQMTQKIQPKFRRHDPRKKFVANERQVQRDQSTLLNPELQRWMKEVDELLMSNNTKCKNESEIKKKNDCNMFSQLLARDYDPALLK
eukprot:m.312011 g.312011  ORF g.312011 m.312011 type:complete len:256 (+) comp198805_c0_seq1:75-842(+)